MGYCSAKCSKAEARHEIPPAPLRLTHLQNNIQAKLIYIKEEFFERVTRKINGESNGKHKPVQENVTHFFLSQMMSTCVTACKHPPHHSSV